MIWDSHWGLEEATVTEVELLREEEGLEAVTEVALLWEEEELKAVTGVTTFREGEQLAALTEVVLLKEGEGFAAVTGVGLAETDGALGDKTVTGGEILAGESEEQEDVTNAESDTLP